jgi:signal transduction histidine kinase
MCAALAIVTALAWWDARSEDAAALSDFGTEQSVVAASVAGVLRARLAAVARDAARVAAEGLASVSSTYEPFGVRAGGAPPPAVRDPARVLLSFAMPDGRFVDLGVAASDLVDRARSIERSGELVVLLAPPGASGLYTTDGRVLQESSGLRAALGRGDSTLRLTRPQAVEVGLPERTAMAGLSRAPSEQGAWGIVAVATAARERDRETRAFWRLVLSVVVACGLVVAFGGLALRTQRAELELAGELAVAEVRRGRDAELLRASRAATMGTFAMGVAHEVATPLAVIVGRAEQLEARVRGDERAVHGVRTILKQADQIQQIVRRFLDLARGAPPSLGLADCAELAQSAVASVAHRFSKANVSLTTDIPPRMPSVRCDRALLEHAMVNLLLNACDACQPGARVELQVRSDAQRAAFVVLDEGSGISAEHAAKVTEPFFTTKLETGGTGLGLAIASEIAKSHHGELTIEPNTPRGTRACISIPVAH